MILKFQMPTCEFAYYVLWYSTGSFVYFHPTPSMGIMDRELRINELTYRYQCHIHHQPDQHQHHPKILEQHIDSYAQSVCDKKTGCEENSLQENP